MGRLNWYRILLGGLACGLVINVGEGVLYLVLPGALGPELDARLLELYDGSLMKGVLALAGFVVGIASVFVYAAIWPRFGTGPLTAVRAGIVVWVLAYLPWAMIVGAAGWVREGGLLLLFGWGLVEIVAANMVGAWFYLDR